jgi:hypothetical protein
LNLSKALYRSWFYFRTGYNTYIAFFIGFSSNIIVIYKLGISENKYLNTIPLLNSLGLFAILALIVLVPLAVSAGLYHMKRTGAYAADASVSTESNPYIYKVLPGKEQEVFLPLWILTVQGLAKMLDQQKAMTSDERKRLEELLHKADSLLEGQYVGRQTRSGVRPSLVTEGDK